MQPIKRLAQNLSGSHYVHYDSVRELVFSWNGSRTVNVYSAHEGIELDCWEYSEVPDLEEVQESIEQFQLDH